MLLTEQLVFRTDMPMQACVGKLMEIIDTSWVVSEGNKSIAGRITKDRFCIYKKMRRGYGNALKLWINGKVIPLSNETRIVCVCGMSPTVMVLVSVLLLFPCLAAMTTACLILAGSIAFRTEMIGSLVFLLGYYVVFIVMLSIARERRVDDQKHMLALIVNAVHAELRAHSSLGD